MGKSPILEEQIQPCNEQINSKKKRVDLLLYILIHIFHFHRVYHELTIDYLCMWPGSSVDRALHRYRKIIKFILFTLIHT